MNTKQRFKLLVSAVAACGCLGAASVAQAALLNWQGQDWDDNYGNTALSLDGSGNLVVTPTPTVISYAAAHYNTSAAFRASATQAVEVSFIDTAVFTDRRELWIEDETASGAAGTLGGWLQVVARGTTYQIGYNDYDADKADNSSVDFSTWTSFDTGIARTAGLHSFGVTRAMDGSIDVWIDGVSRLSLTSAQFNPNYFGDVYLGVRGSAATFSQFDSSTDPRAVPVPATSALIALGVIGMAGLRRRRG